MWLWLLLLRDSWFTIFPPSQQPKAMAGNGRRVLGAFARDTSQPNPSWYCRHFTAQKFHDGNLIPFPAPPSGPCPPHVASGCALRTFRVASSVPSRPPHWSGSGPFTFPQLARIHQLQNCRFQMFGFLEELTTPLLSKNRRDFCENSSPEGQSFRQALLSQN